MGNIIKVKQRGKFKKANIFLKKELSVVQKWKIELYARRGVKALQNATPKDTGLTANSWYYEIVYGDGKVTIEWKNSNENEGYNIALLIQYGHGTRDGHYVAGVDYINPALEPIFESMAKDVWKEVTRA